MKERGEKEKVLSIVTVAFNMASTIEQTFKSITNQTNKDFEYIVIDGGSDDGTVDYIRAYEESIDKWVSEPDCGIGDAMNKGWEKASGQYVLFLHADDQLVDNNSVDIILSHIKGARGYDLYAFNVRFGNTTANKNKRSRGMNFWMNIKTGFWHQGTMMRRDLLQSLGGYSLNYHVAMDYEWFLRAYRQGVRLKKFDVAVSVMSDKGISSERSWEFVKKRIAEERAIHWEHCHSLPLRCLYLVWWSYYPLYKQLVSRH